MTKKICLAAFGALLLLFASASANTSAMVGSSVTENQETYQWIQVPAWLAGTWQTRVRTFFDSIDCSTGRRLLSKPVNIAVSMVRTIGTQQDSYGRIWHYIATPYQRTLETNEYCETQNIIQVSVLSSYTDKLTLRTIGKVVRSPRSRQQLYDNFYEITDVTYSPLSDGIIKVEMKISDFDASGKPLHVSRSICIDRRIRPFTVINYDERGNLEQKFLEFQADKR